MTYLQIVNAVLTRLREDTLTTVAAPDDVVAAMVVEFVNDAKQVVEDAHEWSALNTSWEVTTSNGTAEYSLTNSSNRAKINYVYNASGAQLVQVPLQQIRQEQLANPSATGTPYKYAVSGVDSSSRDLKVVLSAIPDSTATITFYGTNKQDDLSADSDVLLVPSKPVIYLALAYAARERGEVGGQTSQEIFAMAKQYLGDAIAYDDANHNLDTLWQVV